MPIRTGAELFVESMLAYGVREIFTLVGDHLNDVLLAAADSPIRLIDMRHESGCTHAAEAWTRIHRRPAVSLVTGGPGHTNSITGIAAAYLASCPLIAISGAPSRRNAGRGGFQEIDQLSMTRAITKGTAEPESVDEIPEVLARAFEIAMEGRPGPVHISIPVDLFSGMATREVRAAESSVSSAVVPDVTDLLRHLRAAERPVVVAGSGLWWSGTGELLQQFLEQMSLPLYTQTFARGAVPDSHPLCFGYADASLNRATAMAFQEADLVLVLGKRIDYRLAFGGAKLFPTHIKFLQVDIEASELGKNRELAAGVHGDLKDVLPLLVAATANESPRTEQRDHWLGRLGELREDWRAKLASQARDGSTPLSPAAFFKELQRHIPDDALYSWDGGDFVHWGRAMLPANQPGGWMRLGPMAAIGSGLPNSVALKLANPDRPVILFTGDGSLGFYIAEIDSLVRHGLPVVIIVGNDAGWGLERELQSSRDAVPVACELRATRYDVVTKGFGGDGEVVERIDEIGPALQRALAAKTPYCLNVNIRGVRSPFTEWQAGPA